MFAQSGIQAHLAISINPDWAAACKAVQPSLSLMFMSIPLSTRNFTMSMSSLMQAFWAGIFKVLIKCWTQNIHKNTPQPINIIFYDDARVNLVR